MKNKSDKKTETAAENLKKKFQQRADAHIFLGLADEQSRVDQFLKELDTAFKVAEEDVLQRITKVLADVGEVMEETASRLDECRETIKGALEKTCDPWPPDQKALRDLAYQVEAQLKFLHVMVRARTDKYLDRLSPHSGFMPGLLQIFADRYGESVKDLPRIIYRINPRDLNLAPLQGRSVAQAESRSLLDYVCRGKFFPLCLLRFYLWALRSRWRYRIRRVPLQEIANRCLPTRYKLAGHPIVLKWDDVHARPESQLADLWRGIRYNLENTIKDLNARAAGMEASPENGEGTDGLKEMLDGLDVLLENLFSRSAEVLPELESQVRENLQSILPRLEEGHNDLKAVVLSDVSKSQNLEARFLLFQQDAFSLAGGVFTRLAGILLLRMRKRVHSAEALKDRWQTLQGWVFRFLGVPRAVVEDMLKYSDLPSTAEADAFIESLPPVYRGLFSLGPLQSREFLVGRDKELETLGQLVKRWEQDLLCSVAVVGPAGSGKMSLLNCLENECDSTITVKRLEMTRRLRTEEDILKLFAEWFQREKDFGSVTELMNYLRKQPRAVLIVEGGHNLVLRTGGAADCGIFSHHPSPDP
ncbi:MAG: ATP-binding protein [bacterium]|nr:ATP-binding protein [bacterium]MDT8365531.1 ATP-binding protein [bacterium]